MFLELALMLLGAYLFMRASVSEVVSSGLEDYDVLWVEGQVGNVFKGGIILGISASICTYGLLSFIYKIFPLTSKEKESEPT